MNAFDLIFLVLMLLSIAVGLWRGLISEVFALLGLFVALFAAWELAWFCVPLMSALRIADWLQWPLAFLVVFMLVLLLLGLLRFLLRGLLSIAGLSPMDRGLGALFGAARGLLLAVLAVAVAGMTDLPREPWWKTAKLAPPLETAVIAAKPWLPPELGKRIKYR
ncbi:MAG: colicin V production protein [Candidatus Dactylopiibacterium carminicum]|uniref:Colicin V production protein n=1 Tax=Candidatus Dactylopiibacterium carminicum TaxID=857335 RepID=A0A272EXQ8_9RHOO|nr:CvpA family protein [Candidatus Dactylopiibacterium carminicum]KAF7600524.1 colicin V production protein [Candidatus Dactylopiibacterium carminicum]PAS94907.1 MAG: colicin V production protein [Candidatus Dactylopiibacterium carminicum]PAS98043.1 MAG: colicin V production protein [Candidatus Dactylopiibacterium carminicum]PAT00530.1 MAG: hypothetical protein BSR46_02195 [Candidatus Dactylopiibacterium carminicum]